MSGVVCPLCETVSSETMVTPDQRIYYQCAKCYLRFMDQKFFPDKTTEKNRYEEHNNNIENTGYVNFLYQIVRPALPLLQPDMKILDYGCGPAPVLSQILEKEGFSSDYYDPFFYDFPLHPPYHCVFASECFEHFFNPKETISTITRLLHPNGYLCVMTNFWSEQTAFDNWHYRRDVTHVCFYHTHTFAYIARQYNFTIHLTDNDRIVILQKNAD